MASSFLWLTGSQSLCWRRFALWWGSSLPNSAFFPDAASKLLVVLQRVHLVSAQLSRTVSPHPAPSRSGILPFLSRWSRKLYRKITTVLGPDLHMKLLENNIHVSIAGQKARRKHYLNCKARGAVGSPCAEHPGSYHRGFWYLCSFTRG